MNVKLRIILQIIHLAPCAEATRHERENLFIETLKEDKRIQT